MAEIEYPETGAGIGVDMVNQNSETQVFANLLSVVQRLEWSAVTAVPATVAKPCCPICQNTRDIGWHKPGCELDAALRDVSTETEWSWCRCQKCECPDKVDPAEMSVVCRHCAEELHVHLRP